MVFLFIATIVISFALSAAGTYFLAKYARKNHKFMPLPKERDLHRRPTPRIGGLVMIASFTLVILVLNYFKPDFFAELGFPYALGGLALDKRLLGVLVGGVILAAVMAIDDSRGMRAGWKLFWQVIVWAVIVASGIGIIAINNPFGQTITLSHWQSIINISGVNYHFIWLADLLFLVWLLGMMNAVNFIDGVDGLAAGTGIIGFVTIGLLSLFSPAVHQPAVAMLAFIAAAVTAGVLVFNFHPAKVFLGDTGAMWIGYLLAVLSIVYGGKLATLFLVLAVPIVDGFIVVARRLWRGQNPLTTPDQTHVHHRFIKAGFSVSTSVLILYAISALYGVVALTTSGATKWLSLGILIVLTAIFLIIIGRVRPKKESGNIESRK
jgi:UDP-GlcNAc:undecaprenyl-phosphate GlcNAc-1-phosphate transferase